MYILKKYLSSISDDEFLRIFLSLPESSAERIKKYRFESDRKRSAIGEYIARRAISEEIGVPFADIPILRTENGKPYIENGDIYFSITHSENLVAVAVSDKNIGIDCEKFKRINPRTMDIAFTEEEKQYVLSRTEHEEPFFRIWTAKEARIKAMGTNLADIRSESFFEYKSKCFFSYDGEYFLTVYEDSL